MADTNRAKAMVGILREWQSVERQAMNDTAEIMEATDNSLIRIVMEIIRHDSLMHHRVQQYLIDTLQKESPTVSREDVAEIWEKIEAHDEMEKKTIQLAEKLKNDAWNPIHKTLLDYLLRDESKHDTLIEQLGEIKKGMSQASGG